MANIHPGMPDYGRPAPQRHEQRDDRREAMLEMIDVYAAGPRQAPAFNAMSGGPVQHVVGNQRRGYRPVHGGGR